jgi:hypothetical protein
VLTFALVTFLTATFWEFSLLRFPSLSFRTILYFIKTVSLWNYKPYLRQKHLPLKPWGSQRDPNLLSMELVIFNSVSFYFYTISIHATLMPLLVFLNFSEGSRHSSELKHRHPWRVKLSFLCHPLAKNTDTILPSRDFFLSCAETSTIRAHASTSASCCVCFTGHTYQDIFAPWVRTIFQEWFQSPRM